jgi:anti-anti-sigma factor
MKITSYRTYNPKIEVIEVKGDLTGRGAMELKEYLYSCLDESKCKYIINLKHARKINGLGISILVDLIRRGMQIRLFNISSEVRSMLRLSKKEDIIKVYNETDCDKVVSLFEKETLEEKDKGKDYIMGRRHPRIDTFFLAEFKYHPGHNGVVMCKADILNLSKGGIFADKIKTINTKTGKIVSRLEIAGQEFFDLRFKLNGSSEFIETKGECVWEKKKDENLCIGIRFKGMSKIYTDRIGDYVQKALQFKD